MRIRRRLDHHLFETKFNAIYGRAFDLRLPNAGQAALYQRITGHVFTSFRTEYRVIQAGFAGKSSEFQRAPQPVMRAPQQLLLVLLVVVLLHASAVADIKPAADVKIYPAPPSEPASLDYTLSLGDSGADIFVYTSYMFSAASQQKLFGRPVTNLSFASLDFGGGPVSLLVSLPGLNPKTASLMCELVL